MESIIFVVISTLSLAGHSLSANYLFQEKKTLNSSSLLIISILPSFFISIFYLPFLSYSVNITEIILMVFKQSLYAFVIFLRLESFKHLGAFSGGVLLVAQPVAISIVAWILLGEELSILEAVFAVLALSGIWIVNMPKSNKVYSKKIILKYLVLPTILMAFVAVLERYILIGPISAIEFFVIDKILILPTFLIIYFIFTRLWFDDQKISFDRIPKKYFMITIVVIGGFWGVSTLFYGLALELEKTIWVTIIRSLSFTVVALVGAFLDDKRLNAVSLLGLGIATIGSVLFALY